MGEPGHRQLNNGQPGAHNYGHPHLQQGQYQGAGGHPPQPRRSSIQSMLNPPSPEPTGSYGYYSAHHGAPQHQIQHPHQHQHPHPQQQQQQQPYMHPIKQPPPQQPPQPSQHHHQLPQHHQEHYHQDGQYSQSYPYQQHPHTHTQQQQQQQQQHSRPQPHQHQQQPPHQHQQQPHQHQQPQQQSAYYTSHPGPSSAPVSVSKPTSAYSTGPAPLPSISSQTHYRSYSQYSPGSSPSEGAFQSQQASSFQGPPPTALHAHHQQGRHIQHEAGAGPGPAGTQIAPRRTSGESVDMRLQSPPAGASHFGHMSQSHIGARPPSPGSSQDFGRSRQTSVSNHAFHGEYRQHAQETSGGPSYEYYQGSYQDPGYAAGSHPSARQQDPQQHQKIQQQQQQQSQHPQQPHPQQQQQQQHPQQYASQYPPHASSGYMRSSVSEMDRSRSHSISTQQQQQQHYGYSAQSAPQGQQPQHALMSPPRGSMQDIHSGGTRTSVSGQHQQPLQAHHPQERPQPENDEALVMNFMSELQMRQQQQQPNQHQLQHSQAPGQQVHKQPRKSASSPQVPQSGSQMPSHQMYNQHPQHQHVSHPQIHHTPAIQKQQQQQQQPMHMDHSPLPPPHGRYVHGDHHGYPPSHEPLSTSPVYRPQPSSVAPTVVDLPRPMTPPGLVSPGAHPRSQGPMVDTRQRPIPGLGIGSGSESHIVPHSGMQPLDPIKTAHGSGTPTGLAPPRSASLMNILNIPERVNHSRHAQMDDRDDMEDVQPTSAHVPQDRVPVDPSVHQAYRHDPQRSDYLPAFSEAPRDTRYEERFAEPEWPTQVTPAEQDPVEEPTSAAVVAPKAGKEKAVRPVKEKVVKEKPVKPVKEKVEKVKKERVPKGGKKKLSTSATIGIESDEPGMDTAMEHDQSLAEARFQDSRSQEPRSQEFRPPEHRLSELHPQEPHHQETHLQEPRPQEPRPQEPRPQESHPQEPQLQELTGVSKHMLELPGGGRIELASKKSRTESFSAPAPDGDAQRKVLRGSETRHPQDSSDRAPVNRDSVQIQPVELLKPAPATIKDSPVSSRNTPAKFSSPQQSFPVSLPPTESNKAPRMDAASPRETPISKASSAQIRSRSSSPPPTPSSLRGHTGLEVELPGSSLANGSSGSSKKIQQDNDRDRTKTTMSKDVSKSSKASTGGSSTPKEKKPSKKDVVVDRTQVDEVVFVTPKVSKSLDTSKRPHDMDDDIPSPKLPFKSQSTSKKSTSSGQPQSSSLKKRFSRTTETEDGHLGSTGSKAHETQEPISSQDRTSLSEGSRGKSSKPHSSTKVEAEQSSSKVQKSSSSSSNHVAAKEEDVQMEEQPDRGEGLYCICRTVYDPSRFMIACDGCDDWFHGDCVGVAEKDSDMVDKYYCKRCEEKGRFESLKKKCFREGCQKSAGRKSKYCSKECGLLVATQRIQESQEKVFGGETSQTDLPPGQVQQQQHLQRRRRLTLADLDDRQRLLGIREKMAHVRKVCAILEERSVQLGICVDRQLRQDLGPLDLSTVADLNVSSSPHTRANGVSGKSTAAGGAGDMEDEDEGVLRSGSGSGSGSKSKAKAKALKDKAAAKEKDKDALCGFDYSLVWDDAQDIARKDRAALNSLVSTPVGSRASSVAPPSFGVVVVALKRQQQHNGTESSSDHKTKTEGGAHDGDGVGGVQTPSATGEAGSNMTSALASSPYLEAIGQRVCMSRRGCDRHIGWQRLKTAELELEQTLQNKLLRTLKAEAKLVKSRMKRRRNDLSARILNGTIEH
ncbi:hypothetical protein BG015_009855 [Linnemannia schmuckeri]|uniref:PHD-type domain-containing protein n=1 Tax=Linnemannia schmuckeri TaxID=64567 RepID=A0A9P5V916_9FUNG|nr:hypothetical protein BG015_009855 [Linnemannia schmuckeri]